MTEGRTSASTLYRLTPSQYPERIQRLRIPLSGTDTFFSVGSFNSMDTFRNRLLIGTSDGRHIKIFSYGTEEKGQPLAMTMPYGVASGSTSSTFGCLKTLFVNKIFISYKKDSVYYLDKIASGNSTRAYYKGGYFEADQRIRVNYVKFYFKTLVASDSVTVSLDTDYGTSNDLRDLAGNKTITYTNDGAVNYKRFDVGVDCHSFRPVIDWSAGGVAFAKIVVDFDYISD